MSGESFHSQVNKMPRSSKKSRRRKRSKRSRRRGTRHKSYRGSMVYTYGDHTLPEGGVWVPERFKQSMFDPSLVYNTNCEKDEEKYIKNKEPRIKGCETAHFDPTVDEFKLNEGEKVRLFKTSAGVPNPESHTRFALARIMNELVTDLSIDGGTTNTFRSQGIQQSPAFHKLHPEEKNNLLTNLTKINVFNETSMDIGSNREDLLNTLTWITLVPTFEPITHIDNDSQSVFVKTEHWRIIFSHSNRAFTTVFDSIRAYHDSGRILSSRDQFTVKLKYDTRLDARVAELFKLDDFVDFVDENNILTIQSDYSDSRPGRNKTSPITKEEVEHLLRRAKKIQIIEKGG